ncbi:MAG: SCO family protein [Desulfotalea sp.]
MNRLLFSLSLLLFLSVSAGLVFAEPVEDKDTIKTAITSTNESIQTDDGHDHDHQAMIAAKQPPGVIEKSGQFIPLTATFKTVTGEPIALAQIVDRPTLLLPVYYYCPSSCSFDMANLAEALRQTKIELGSFRIITMSFDESEGPEAAAGARENYTEILDDSFPLDSWYFLTGDKENISKVTRSIGYSFKPGADGTFIHPSAIAVLSGEGKIIKYVYGAFLSGDVDLALSEAEKGTPAISIRRFLSFCFNGDPKQNQKVFTFLKISAFLILASGAVFFVRFLTKERK